MKKRRNPLNHRLLRELKEELGKYLVIFLLMTLTVGFVSGFLVADNSMIAAYNEGFEKYNIEDGHFQTDKKLNGAQMKRLQAYGYELYELHYTEANLTNGSKLRIYSKRDSVNLECLMEGAFPENPGEIAIDRMYADNNDLTVGDIIEDANETWTITGLVALSDYSCLFENNTDSMFDALIFGVGVVSEEAFEQMSARPLTWVYAWIYPEKPADDTEEKAWADDWMEYLNQEVKLKDFVPLYTNQAITFTGDDMGSDKAMMLMLLYIVIVIMAFVFGITISNTITKESAVIGTLRASGYTRRELLRHYMILPVSVTLLGAVAGNIAGYTVMKDFCAGLYYGSYSLPTYVTIWNAEAFFMTTLVPVAMMVVINYVILNLKLRISLLRFLRGDLTGRRTGRSLPLSERIPFFSRFRLRVIFQNLPGYMMMLIGIFFVNMLILFGLGLPDMLDYFQEEMQTGRICEYQYMLQLPTEMQSSSSKTESLLASLRYLRAVETDTPGAEKFSAYTLKTVVTDAVVDDVVLYGLAPDSSYIDLDTSDEKVYISAAYADKFNLTEGDSITLKEAYEDTTYTFTINGIYDYMGALNVYMDQTYLNRTFDMDDEMFVGYFSDVEITDIDEDYIGSVIDLDALTKISRQLDRSMGGMMNLFVAFAVLIFIAVIYLLSKIIIERNAQSISMAKILGYQSGEIVRLYVMSTTIVVFISLLIVMPLNYALLVKLFGALLREMMAGWLPLHVESMTFVQAFLIGAGTYLLVMVLEIRRIRRIPMDSALKNVE